MRTEHIRMHEASEWLVSLQDKELSAEQISGWLEWSQAHPENLEAFEKLKTLRQDIKGLDADRKAAALRRLMPAAPDAAPAKFRKFHRSRYALAAGLMFVVLGAGLWWLQQRAHDGPFSDAYITGTAEDRAMALPDGTRVRLGARSRLKVAYTTSLRTVELSDGEAFFEIAEDERRPFFVSAGDWQLTDIGTAFNVRKTAGQVVVTVADGIVDVAPAVARPDAPPLRILAGEQVVMDAALMPGRVAKVDSAAATSWQQGQLRFSNETLAVVAANLNRYSAREIVFADPGIAQLRFSGTVLTGNIQGWLEAACRVFSLRQEEHSGRLLLYRNTP